jgi:rSAM/selenodomain-associated transferase 1
MEPELKRPPHRPAGERPILVFAREPRPGFVKTRLAPPLSPEQAAEVYEACLRDVVALARSIASDVRILHDPAPGASAWFRREFPDVPAAAQAAGHLGRRLERAFAGVLDGVRETRPDGAVVLGSDVPTLPAAHLRAGLAALDEAEVVLGPALDGGYCLVGVRRDAWPRAAVLFRDVPWSTDAVFRTTLARADDAGLSVRQLAAWYDVDVPSDLAIAARDAEAGSHLGGLVARTGLPPAAATTNAPAGPRTLPETCA